MKKKLFVIVFLQCIIIPQLFSLTPQRVDIYLKNEFSTKQTMEFPIFQNDGRKTSWIEALSVEAMWMKDKRYTKATAQFIWYGTPPMRQSLARNLRTS